MRMLTGSGGRASEMFVVSGRIPSETTIVVLHEFGHTLGWSGHSYDSGDVMFATMGRNSPSLTRIEVEHLRQIYDRFR